MSEKQKQFSRLNYIVKIQIYYIVKSYFGVGTIYKNGKDCIQLRVTSIKDLTNHIIPHFKNYPLISKKRADFEIFKQVLDIMNRKEHLTTEGLNKIVSLRASMS